MKKKSKKTKSIILNFLTITNLFIILFSVVKTYALTDPHKNWRTLNTPHFEIVFSESQRSLAYLYAHKAETVFQLITPHLKEYPPKTILIINDSTDLANGYATRIPYPHIMLYPVLPTAFDTIGEYGDWAFELFLHEYVHILSFEPSHGFMGALRSALGTIASPNMLMPRWWLEGLAVEYETRFSKNGRLKSIQQDSSLRALELENKWNSYTIAEMNESELPTWPRGSRPYVFGSLIMSEIISEIGTGALNDLTQAQSSRVPYFIEAPIYRITDKDYETWFFEAITSTQNLVKDQLAILKTKPPTIFTNLNIKGLESRSPTMSPNGQYLTILFRNQFGKMNIKVLDRKDEQRPFDFEKDTFEDMNQEKDSTKETGGDKLDAPPGGTVNRMAWSDDSSGFVFDKLKFVDSYNYYSDLYFYNILQKKTFKLTHNLRAREPHISPTSDKIVFVHTANGTTQLGLINLNQKVQEINSESPLSIFEILYSPGEQSRISSPTFTDNNKIVFVLKKEDGTQKLYSLSIDSKNTQPEEIKLPLSHPQFISKVNNSSLFFSATENGTFNGYVSNLKFNDTLRLTHAQTAVYDLALDQRTNELYATVITSSGFQVQKTNYQPESLKTKLPSIKPLFVDRYNQELQFNTSSTLGSSSEKISTSNSNLEPDAEYSSTGYLAPTYWLPFVYSSGKGLGAQISTSGQDPLELQSYTAQASWDSSTSQSGLALLYNNQTTKLPTSFLINTTRQENPISKVSTDQLYTKVFITKDLKPWSDSLSWTTGIADHQISSKNSSRNWHKSGVEIGLVYNSVSSSNYSAVPVGGGYSILTSSYFPKTNDTYNFDRTIYEGGIYHSKYAPFDGVFIGRLRAQYISVPLSPASQTFDFATNEISPLTNNLISSGYVLRGYDTNYFLFKSGANTTFEYSLPLPSHGKGWGTIPLFIKRARIHFYTDFLAAKGIALNTVPRTYSYIDTKKVFTSYGAEFKLDTTLGYYIPISWVLGFYNMPDYSGPIKNTMFIGMQM